MHRAVDHGPKGSRSCLVQQRENGQLEDGGAALLRPNDGAASAAAGLDALMMEVVLDMDTGCGENPKTLTPKPCITPPPAKANPCRAATP